ncbi:MAG TPA: hypothetical protein VGX26_10380 [Solirubrobacteraceae bacterium]|nr:hypothetical protein [Solirubrobacteraceae bacterium]
MSGTRPPANSTPGVATLIVRACQVGIRHPLLGLNAGELAAHRYSFSGHSAGPGTPSPSSGFGAGGWYTRPARRALPSTTIRLAAT